MGPVTLRGPQRGAHGRSWAPRRPAAGGWPRCESAIACGAWKGLAALYERRSEPGRLERLLPYEWRKCVGKISREENVRHWHTSDLSTRPPVGESASSAEYGLIRQWLTAILCAAEDPERVKGWGRRAIAVRLVLLALGQAAMVSGSSVVEFGTRNLALHSALSHRTVSRVLRILRDEPDPLIDLVSVRKLARADRYALRIPDRYADSVRWRRRRAGRVEAAHPAFLVLGGTAALVYEALGPDRCPRRRGRPGGPAERVGSIGRAAGARRARARRARPGRMAPRSRRPGRRRRVDRRGRPAARTRGAVQAGPGELAGPAPAIRQGAVTRRGAA